MNLLGVMVFGGLLGWLLGLLMGMWMADSQGWPSDTDPFMP